MVSKIHASIPAELEQELRRYAAQSHLKISTVVTLALEAYLEPKKIRKRTKK